MSTTLKRIATTAVTAITMALIFVFDSVAIIASEPAPTITLPENSWDNSVEIAPGTSVDLPDPSRDEAINKALTNDNKDIIKNYYSQSFANDAALNAAIEGATVNNYSYSQGYVNGEDHRSAIGSPDLNEGYYDWHNKSFVINPDGTFIDSTVVPEDKSFFYETYVQIAYDIILADDSSSVVHVISPYHNNNYYTVRVRKIVPRPSSNESSSDNSQSASEETLGEYETAEQALQAVSEYNSTVSVNGSQIRSTVTGLFTASSVAGTAITTPAAQINESFGIKEGETVSVTTWDVTDRTSPLAHSSLANAAKNMDAEMGPAIQVNINKMSGGRLSAVDANGKASMTVGIPADFYQEGVEYAILHVMPGGAVELLKDTDKDPLTISFPVSAGNGAYALIRIK